MSRCEFFIGFLGGRYGWAPASYEVPDHPRFHWLKYYPKERSITELEMHAAALSEQAQSNGKSCFFYFRDPSFLPTVPENYRQYFVEANPESTEKMENLKERIISAGIYFFTFNNNILFFF